MKRFLPLVFLCSSLLCFAAAKDNPPSISAADIETRHTPVRAFDARDLSSEAKLRIFFYSEKVSREQLSLNTLQNLINDAKQRTQNAFIAYQQVVAEEVKKAGLPEGTQVWPNLDTNDFVVTPPETKPEDKKADTPASPAPMGPSVPTPAK